MLADHHNDSRVIRVLILTWALLLLLLVLLPIRAHGHQETLEPPVSVEELDESPTLPPEVLNGIAAEMLFLWFAIFAFLIFNANLQRDDQRR